MLALDAQLRKFGKFRGSRVVRIYAKFAENQYTLSASTIKAAFDSQGWNITSVSRELPQGVYINADVLNEFSVSDIGRNARTILSNFGTVSYITVDGATVLGASASTGINTAYNPNTSNQNFPNYNPNTTYNQNTNTINTDNTNLLVSGDYYKVQKGDTLASIAKKFKTTVTRLKELNEIVNINQIYVGQAIKVKGSSKVITDTKTTVSNNSSSNGGNGLDDLLSYIKNSGGGGSDEKSGGFLDSLGLGLGVSTPVILLIAATGVILILKK